MSQPAAQMGLREQPGAGHRRKRPRNPIAVARAQPEQSQHFARSERNNRTSRVMPLSRRHFIGITASAIALAYKPANAQDDRALFWRIETPDGGRGVVFGYARVAS